MVNCKQSDNYQTRLVRLVLTGLSIFMALCQIKRNRINKKYFCHICFCTHEEKVKICDTEKKTAKKKKKKFRKQQKSNFYLVSLYNTIDPWYGSIELDVCVRVLVYICAGAYAYIHVYMRICIHAVCKNKRGRRKRFTHPPPVW